MSNTWTLPQTTGEIDPSFTRPPFRAAAPDRTGLPRRSEAGRKGSKPQIFSSLSWVPIASFLPAAPLVFSSCDVLQGFKERTVGKLFGSFPTLSVLPVSVIVPPAGDRAAPVSRWVSRVDPPQNDVVELPMKIVDIRRNKA